MEASLQTDLRYLKGVGEKRASLYAKLGLFTLEDLLRHYPRNYIDHSAPFPISAAPFGENCAVRARVVSKSGEQRIRKGLSLFKVLVTDGSADLYLTFFNARYTVSALKTEEEYLFYGRMGGKFTRREMASPLVISPEGEEAFSPVYPLTEGLTSRSVGANIRQALSLLEGRIPETLPPALRERFGLCGLEEALRCVHLPPSAGALEQARRRLIFEELFVLALALTRLKQHSGQTTGAPMRPAELSGFERLLPFSLTGAQRRAIGECFADLAGPRPMNRLVQGDVGSGKTMVAAAAVWFAAQNGYQSALMVPTEILAEQHFSTLSRLFEGSGLKVALLTGSVRAAQRELLLRKLRQGDISLLIGTHALIQSGVDFHRLGLVVTDEQHRFGVSQRTALSQKGEAPHVLVLSATPIPRTLAFIIYGDLDISVIDELPAGRKSIKTYLIDPPKRQRACGFIRKYLDEGYQAYIVCPLVEQGEETAPGLLAAQEYAEQLSAREFAGYRVGLLHGRMKGAEKDSVMARFASGEIQLLVATTVIEVGVDVPNAVVMMIENAERFGLSQLHQLRGRVGRGEAQSHCILVSETPSPRLRAICRTNDGFAIAEEDLKLRGPGDFFGTRQHGLPRLKIADMAGDMELVRTTQDAAAWLLREDPELSAPENRALGGQVLQMLQKVTTG
ncbi:MAG: ATP-dependent DNA helicase RecG [Oscillospiraceae bacterium]|nr:ATP-dependent DNA helicase RecG [Oscillospiraceae bacterium]